MESEGQKLRKFIAIGIDGVQALWAELHLAQVKFLTLSMRCVLCSNRIKMTRFAKNSLPPALQMLLQTLFILPVHLCSAGGSHNTAGHLPGYFPLRTAPVKGFKNAPSFEHHRTLVFGESELEQLVKVVLAEGRLK